MWGGLTDEDLATIDSSIYNSVSTTQTTQVGNKTATNPETRRNQVEKHVGLLEILTRKTTPEITR